VSFEGFGVGSSSAVWGRRAVTIPLYLLLTGLAVVVLPFALVGALCVDLTRGGSFPAVRTILFFAYYLACESLGLVASFLVWLAGGLWGGASRERYLLWNFRLQCAWARWLFSGASRIFSFHVEVEGEDSAQRGPLLLFMRHASVADTLLPAVLSSNASCSGILVWMSWVDGFPTSSCAGARMTLHVRSSWCGGWPGVAQVKRAC
jgi:hypothetical protein